LTKQKKIIVTEFLILDIYNVKNINLSKEPNLRAIETKTKKRLSIESKYSIK
jgi:hypothetical protein